MMRESQRALIVIRAELDNDLKTLERDISDVESQLSDLRMMREGISAACACAGIRLGDI